MHFQTFSRENVGLCLSMGNVTFEPSKTLTTWLTDTYDGMAALETNCTDKLQLKKKVKCVSGVLWLSVLVSRSLMIKTSVVVVASHSCRYLHLVIRPNRLMLNSSWQLTVIFNNVKFRCIF